MARTRLVATLICAVLWAVSNRAAAQATQPHPDIPSELHDCKPILTGDQSKSQTEDQSKVQMACTAQSKVDDVLKGSWKEVGAAALTALQLTRNRAALTNQVKGVVPNEKVAAKVASKAYEISHMKGIRSALGLVVIASGAVGIYEWIADKNEAVLIDVVRPSPSIPPSPGNPHISTATNKPDVPSTARKSDVDFVEGH
jgi:hypothetical protein